MDLRNFDDKIANERLSVNKILGVIAVENSSPRNITHASPALLGGV